MRLTLITRSLATFQAYLDGPLRNFFYSDKYLDELAKRLDESHQRLARISGICFIVLALVLFSASVGTVSLTWVGVQFTDIHALRDALLFVLASLAFHHEHRCN